MATVTVLTAEKTLEDLGKIVTKVEVVDGDVILTLTNDDQVNVGPIDSNPPVVTGSRGGNAALASLLTQLAANNYIVNNTTA